MQKYSYEEKRRREEERMERRIKAQEKRVYGLFTNMVVSAITALVITLLLTK
jgi:hypothetical protein